MSINVCKNISCPYFNPNNNGFGCQRYQVAPHCHLTKVYQFSETQYALYAPDDYDNFADVKDSNDSFFLSDQKYTADLEFVRKILTGLRVGK